MNGALGPPRSGQPPAGPRGYGGEACARVILAQGGPMLFRIVAPHTHRAVVGATTFLCIRRAITTEAGMAITWAAYRNDVVLRPNCPTLNDAKNLCRAAAAAGAPTAPPVA